MKDFFENPALLIGAPLLVVGLAGAMIALLAAFAPEPRSLEPAGLSLGPGKAPPGGQAHGGPSAAEYVNIGLVLAAITGLEVGVYYVTALGNILVPVLIALAASKFILVVLFFMHLKFDNRLFSTMFTAGLVLAFAVFTVVLVTLGASIT